MTTFINDPVTGELISDETTPSTPSVSGGSDGGDSLWSGLGGLFSTLGTTVATDYKAAQGPTNLAPGQTVLTANGQVITAPGAGLAAITSGGMGAILLLGVAILIVYLALRSR